MRRICILFLFCITLPLFSVSLQLQLDAVYPNQMHLHWPEVAGAEYYDLYLNKEPMLHTGQTKAILGSNERPLTSHTRYEVLIAARKKGVGELAVGSLLVDTPGWEGHYRWKNLTKDDNKGKCKQLDFLVSFISDSYVIHGLFEQPCQLHPLVPPSLIGEQISYEGNSSHQIAYRLNTEVFNTTNLKPKSWRVVRMESTGDQLGIEVETIVGMLR
ncbi:MAG: hypothetical protein ACQ5SW_14255, partial [Sphaerochaetaceae bacterium]